MTGRGQAVGQLEEAQQFGAVAVDIGVAAGLGQLSGAGIGSGTALLALVRQQTKLGHGGKLLVYRGLGNGQGSPPQGLG